MRAMRMEGAEGEGLSAAAFSVWAKSGKLQDDAGLPLWCHLDDSAAVAGRLWDEWIPASVKGAISDVLPDGDTDAKRLVMWLAGVHDIGKATPAFAGQVPALAGRMRDQGLEILPIPYEDRKLAPHATAGQILLEDWLCHVRGWEWSHARPFAVVVGGHHGVPPTHKDLEEARRRPELLGLGRSQELWREVHRAFLDRAASRLGVADRLKHWQGVRLPQPVQVLLTAIVIVADWIASNDELFPYDSAVLSSPTRLGDAWNELDLPTPWQAVVSRVSSADVFGERFGLAAPRPVQTRAVELALAVPKPGLMVIEAPMGEGKTEAALAVAEVFAARSGAGGCFVALPTRATSDAMFPRVLDWLERLPDADPDRGARAMTLAHGKAWFNDEFQSLMRRGRSTAVDGDASNVAAHKWLSGRKIRLLSSFAVGTIDQLLFGALKARHLVLRHLGLAGKVVIIDEAHAYDVYMGQYLDRALEWLGAYRVPTIVLSATLPASRRRDMLMAYDRGAAGEAFTPRRKSWRRTESTEEAAPDPYGILDGDVGYPVLIASGASNGPLVQNAEPSGRTVPVAVERLDDDHETLAALLRTELTEGGCALVIRNTVTRVQQAAAHLRRALAADGIEVTVAHSRFMAPDRAAKDKWLRDRFGPPERLAEAGHVRPARYVVVASQVAEQSLDIDFDLLVTDLAPVDLVLQRTGRLHRHPRGVEQSDRPERLRHARCLVTGVDWTSSTPPTPVKGSRRVYDEYTLLRSLAVLTPYLDTDRPVRLPTDIAALVQTAYSDQAVGPDDWQAKLVSTRRAYERQQEAKRTNADTFRIGPVGAGGESLLGWLDAGVGDADDDPKGHGRAQVRDTPAESVEVIVVVRQSGVLVTPPWLDKHGGRELPTDQTPPPHLARMLATCTLPLPIQLCSLDAVNELEQRNYFPAWQESIWLAEQLVLVFDEDCNSSLAGYDLHYTPSNGLEVQRRE